MKNTGLKSNVSLGEKKELPIKTSQNPDKVNKLSKKIHNPKEETVRVTIDIPESMYMDMKIKVLQERTTVRKYFLNLLAADTKHHI